MPLRNRLATSQHNAVAALSLKLRIQTIKQNAEEQRKKENKG